MMITGNIHAPDLGVVGAQGPDQNPCPRPTNPGLCLVFVCHSLKWFLFAHAFCKYISFVCVWHLFKVRTSLYSNIFSHSALLLVRLFVLMFIAALHP